TPLDDPLPAPSAPSDDATGRTADAGLPAGPDLPGGLGLPAGPDLPGGLGLPGGAGLPTGSGSLGGLIPRLADAIGGLLGPPGDGLADPGFDEPFADEPFDEEP